MKRLEFQTSYETGVVYSCASSAYCSPIHHNYSEYRSLTIDCCNTNNCNGTNQNVFNRFVFVVGLILKFIF